MADEPTTQGQGQELDVPEGFRAYRLNGKTHYVPDDVSKEAAANLLRDRLYGDKSIYQRVKEGVQSHHEEFMKELDRKSKQSSGERLKEIGSNLVFGDDVTNSLIRATAAGPVVGKVGSLTSGIVRSPLASWLLGALGRTGATAGLEAARAGAQGKDAGEAAKSAAITSGAIEALLGGVQGLSAAPGVFKNFLSKALAQAGAQPTSAGTGVKTVMTPDPAQTRTLYSATGQPMKTVTAWPSPIPGGTVQSKDVLRWRPPSSTTPAQPPPQNLAGGMDVAASESDIGQMIGLYMMKMLLDRAQSQKPQQ